MTPDWRGILLFAALLVPGSASAQLISPGKLSSPHAELEGVRNCTSCHELRTRGIAPERCLACHRPLAARVAAGTGLHAGTDYAACASCHAEHLGPDYEPVRWDPETFDHPAIGFELEDAHAALDCRACHTSPLVRDPDVRTFKGRYGALNRTYLGLGRECVDCHEADDPHEGGFDPRPCSDCHDQTDWATARDSFDHDETRYPLTGRHRTVGCSDCHRREPYRGLRYAACTDCHSDPHEGAMQAECGSCHTTDGWGRVSREAVESGFDHARVYPLVGAHAAADCGSCHDPRGTRDGALSISYRAGTTTRAYPAPISESCASCHVDPHGDELSHRADGGACAACHGELAWYPSTFDIARHETETAFPLTGAHVATPCVACHVDPPGRGQFVLDGSNCLACHAAEQPHGDQFLARDCRACHGTESFRLAEFDHSTTSYPLEGAHALVACASCHREVEQDGERLVRYRPVPHASCSDCHGG